MNYKELKKHASDCQMVSDEMAFILINYEEKTRKLSILQNYCNFNVYHTIGLLGWRQDGVNFIIENGNDLKRRFELDEFFNFLELFRRKSMAKKIKTFEDLKVRNPNKGANPGSL
jgi:hypothetical protein